MTSTCSGSKYSFSLDLCPGQLLDEQEIWIENETSTQTPSEQRTSFVCGERVQRVGLVGEKASVRLMACSCLLCDGGEEGFVSESSFLRGLSVSQAESASARRRPSGVFVRGEGSGSERKRESGSESSWVGELRALEGASGMLKWKWSGHVWERPESESATVSPMESGVCGRRGSGRWFWRRDGAWVRESASRNPTCLVHVLAE